MKIIFLGLFNLFYTIVSSNVIELDSSFAQLIGDGPWLVKFYAPWCGYCRKLEPVYTEVEVQSRNLPIKIARLDATRFPEISSLFQIRGYPTIKYINGTDVYTHEGDRTVQHLTRFIRRAIGPSVKHLPSVGRFHEALENQQSDPFFLYIGPKESYLRRIYAEVADNLRLNCFFFSVESNVIPEEYSTVIKFEPTLSDPDNGTIIVWKEDKKIAFHFADSIENLNDSLRNWIMINRFQLFPKVTHHDMWDMEILHKPLVIFLLNSSDIPEQNLKDIDPNADQSPSKRLVLLAQAMLESTEHNVNNFQFVWSTDTAGVSDMAMTGLLTPNILIYQPWNTTIYLLPEYTNHRHLQTIDSVAILEFLQLFQAGNIQGYGGTGFKAKLQRFGYDFATGFIEFITTTPLLAMFILGIPISVISFICYAVCYIDSGEDQPLELRPQKKLRKPIYETRLCSMEELNIKSDIDKKVD